MRMPDDASLSCLLNSLPLHRLGEEGEAGLWTVSLPLPRNASTDVTIGGLPAHQLGLGQWYDVEAPSPRRLLISAQPSSATAPATTQITSLGEATATAAPPTAELTRLEWSGEPLFIWECHAVRIVWQGVELDLVMGLRTGDEIHWWEAASLVEKEVTPTCRTIEVGGAIPLEKNGIAEYVGDPSLNNRFLHHHNWLNGHLSARLHSNGVCEVFAHHINSKFFDDGLDLEDAVAVVGLRVAGATPSAAGICGPWDGSRPQFSLGGVCFDMSEAARLATPELPGSMEARDDGFLVWQPYAGVDIYGGWGTNADGSQRQFVSASDKRIPRGIARTLRFSFSLSPSASPRIARYLPPAWWYGLCEEFSGQPLLPVSNVYDSKLKRLRDWLISRTVAGGFEDGSAPRNEGRSAGERLDPGWEGEIAYTLLLSAWRNGDAEAYATALRQAYYFTDICIDHAAKTARMPGFWLPAIALPHFRVHACVGAYLETGDEYCLDTARAVVETAHWINRNSWPRPAVGRDAAYVRGAVLLYRYFADTHFRQVAEAGIAMVCHVQRDDGSFGDQGGGSGIHQIATPITKPWMGLMAVGGALDYLELMPDHAPSLEAVERFAAWLMAERFYHSGAVCWTYQHNYNNGNEMLNATTGKGSILKHRDAGIWHQEYLARLLMFRAQRSGEAAYLHAWAESYRADQTLRPKMEFGDHACAQALQFLPWLQDRLWQARLSGQGIVAQPIWFGRETPLEGTIIAPQGNLQVAWLRRGECQQHPIVELAPQMLHVSVEKPPNLATYVACGFPGDTDAAIAKVGVAGIDREQAQSMVRLCEATEPYLYDGSFSPRHLTYTPGSRPQLERIAATLPAAPYDYARGAMQWVCDHVAHPLVCGPTPPDRAMTEEELIASGAGWCNEQTRIFVALCQVRELPSRLLFQFYANLRSGHTVAEVLIDGRWVFFDITFNLTVRLPDGRLAEGRDLHGDYRHVAHEAYRPSLEATYAKFHPWAEQTSGWCAANRPTVDTGGDLFAHLGIANYVIKGVSSP